MDLFWMCIGLIFMMITKWHKSVHLDDSPEYNRMVDTIAGWFGLQSLKFTKIETLIRAIGLPRNQICTHCFNCNSSHTLK